jgi:hypothetical protein
MKEMIESDFNVSTVFEADDRTFFLARRTDHWHLVVHMTAADGASTLTQRYVPRYATAKATSDLLAASAADAGPKVTPSSRYAGIALVGSSQLMFTEPVESGVLHKSVFDAFAEDIEILNRASLAITHNEGQWSLPNALTHSSNPVSHPSRSLIEAIAFERESRGHLDPGNFGIYSAFCTWRDFIDGVPGKAESLGKSTLTELLSNALESLFDDAYWADLCELQRSIVGRVLFSPQHPYNLDDVLNRFEPVFSGLTSVKAAQYCLLNGMQSGGPLHPLAYVLGIQDIATLNYWRTYPFQPDSGDTQDILAVNSYIDLFGFLAQESLTN